MGLTPLGGPDHRVLVSSTVARAETRAGAEQLWIAQAGQPSPLGGVGYDQDGVELVDRLGAGLDRGVLGSLERPGAVVEPDRAPSVSHITMDWRGRALNSHEVIVWEDRRDHHRHPVWP
ncbi:hypothetical protein ACFW5I_04050 [Streptomyces sp. NPDC058818]|uniref:hypothetical protein n=1 Tax=Streptomyces sp. NPDC058818 TaxID=3346640 RepID=UPI00368E5345